MAIKIIQNQAEEVMSDELEDVLNNLESLSEAEVEKLLGQM